jgi:hypothetical protein
VYFREARVDSITAPPHTPGEGIVLVPTGMGRAAPDGPILDNWFPGAASAQLYRAIREGTHPDRQGRASSSDGLHPRRVLGRNGDAARGPCCHDAIPVLSTTPRHGKNTEAPLWS